MTKEEEKLINLEKACIAQRQKCLAEKRERTLSILRTPAVTKGIIVRDINSNKDKLEFTLNTSMTKEKYKSNDFLKNVVFDVVIANSTFNLKRGKTLKLCVWISQFLPLTKTGVIRTDVDNADTKGIIDGVAQALHIDDNGLNISLHSEILSLANGEKPYTRITIVRDELIREIINQM